MEERQNAGIEQEKLKPKGSYAFKSFSSLFFFSPPSGMMLNWTLCFELGATVLPRR